MGIVIGEFEVKNKHKLRVLQVERGVPEEVSYRFDDLKSGKVVVSPDCCIWPVLIRCRCIDLDCEVCLWICSRCRFIPYQQSCRCRMHLVLGLLVVMVVMADGGGGGWITSLTRSWLQKCEVATTHVRSYILSCSSLASHWRERRG